MNPGFFDNAYSNGLNRTIRFLRSRGVPSSLAPDIAQSAWTRGWERRQQLRDETTILSWINAIALNYSRRSLRSISREQEWTPSLKSNRTDSLNVAAIDLDGILNACNPNDRTLLQAQLEGTTAKELAHEQGMSEMAIRLRLFRARRSARRICEAPLPLPKVA